MKHPHAVQPPHADPAPQPGIDWTTFGPKLRAAKRRVLFLDYDGTLAPFHEDRMQAQPYPGVREALVRVIAAGHTQVIVVTGRTVDTVQAVLGMHPAPETWGVHGWERVHADGRREDFDPGPVVREGLRRALEPAGDATWTDWASHWETKPTGLAFHFRGLPEHLQTHFRKEVEPLWRTIEKEHGIGVHHFDFGLELRVPGRTKGTVVATVLAEGPWPVAAAFLGDDFTDENAFAELRGRNDAGLLGVLVKTDWRPTSAQVWIRPPGEVLEFLERWNREAKPGKGK